MARTTGSYVRYATTSPVTGTRVRVLDLSHEDSTRAPGSIVEHRNVAGVPVKVRRLRWGSECVEHDRVVEHEVLSDAKVSADDPTDWCARCVPSPG